MPAESVNGTTLNYEQRGKGMPVVLLHAFPLDNRIWQGQLVSLSDRYRVITPDLRGFGKSPSADAFTMDSLAEDVHALLERIGALPCVLGGLSMGGYIAFAFAKKYLSDLRGLVLLDARAEADTAQGKQKRDEMIAAVRTGGSKVAADAMLPKLLADESIHHKPELVRQVKSIMESQPPLTVEHALEALRDREDHVRNLPSIAVPTLILVGEKDAITPPAMSESMNKAIPRSQLVLIKGAGHLSSMEQPEQVNQAIRRFLDGLPNA